MRPVADSLVEEKLHRHREHLLHILRPDQRAATALGALGAAAATAATTASAPAAGRGGGGGLGGVAGQVRHQRRHGALQDAAPHRTRELNLELARLALRRRRRRLGRRRRRLVRSEAAGAGGVGGRRRDALSAWRRRGVEEEGGVAEAHQQRAPALRAVEQRVPVQHQHQLHQQRHQLETAGAAGAAAVGREQLQQPLLPARLPEQRVAVGAPGARELRQVREGLLLDGARRRWQQPQQRPQQRRVLDGLCGQRRHVLRHKVRQPDQRVEQCGVGVVGERRGAHRMRDARPQTRRGRQLLAARREQQAEQPQRRQPQHLRLAVHEVGEGVEDGRLAPLVLLGEARHQLHADAAELPERREAARLVLGRQPHQQELDDVAEDVGVAAAAQRRDQARHVGRGEVRAREQRDQLEHARPQLAQAVGVRPLAHHLAGDRVAQRLAAVGGG